MLTIYFVYYMCTHIIFPLSNNITPLCFQSYDNIDTLYSMHFCKCQYCQVYLTNNFLPFAYLSDMRHNK